MFSKINLILRFLLFSLMLFGCLRFTFKANAAINPEWSNPDRVPGLVDSGYYPVLLEDSEGTIHLFHSQPVGDTLVIYYTCWSNERGWANLVDIITSPYADARILGATLDNKGWVHLIFWGGNNLWANLYYSKAPISNANDSTAWLEPTLIGESAFDPPTGMIAMDDTGSLITIYSSKLRGNGLYLTQSDDSGESWTNPKPLYLTYTNQIWPTASKFYADHDGNIYLVWSVANETGNGQAVYFSERSSNTRLWSPPYLIAEAIDYEADTPSIIKYKDELILIYHNDFPTTQWMRTSLDNGKTWSEPIRLFEQVGGNGAASLVIDNKNVLHMFFGSRIDATVTQGAWHSQWLGDRWSIPDAIISGPPIAEGENGEEGFDPSFLQAIISHGNIMFVIWRHDPAAGPQNIWYSYHFLDNPEIPITNSTQINLKTPVITTQPSEVQTPDVTLTLTTSEYDHLTPNIPSIPETQSKNANTIIIVSLVPIAILLLVIISVIKFKK